jgi:hypothetical protein
MQRILNTLNTRFALPSEALRISYAELPIGRHSIIPDLPLYLSHDRHDHCLLVGFYLHP